MSATTSDVSSIAIALRRLDLDDREPYKMCRSCTLYVSRRYSRYTSMPTAALR
ncbi:MAG: hypothetical protein K2G77_09035 [Muribaculaceae bacterium]|nr:hypothetical protein [Muribaculaceae bacterium]